MEFTDLWYAWQGKRILIFAPSFRSGPVIKVIYGFSHEIEVMAKADSFRFLNPDLKDGAKLEPALNSNCNLDAIALVYMVILIFLQSLIVLFFPKSGFTTVFLLSINDSLSRNTL